MTTDSVARGTLINLATRLLGVALVLGITAITARIGLRAGSSTVRKSSKKFALLPRNTASACCNSPACGRWEIQR